MNTALKLICTLFFVAISFNVSIADWFWNSEPEWYICQWGECSLEIGTEQAKWTLEGIEQDRTLSEFVIAVVLYLLTFLALVAVVIIIYAGFNILTSGGDEEKLKSSRRIILYALLGIVLIFLAFSIFTWLEWLLNAEL